MSKVNIVIFDGTNFHDWETALLYFLQGKGLASTLTEDPPTDTTELKEWKKIDNLALGKIGERVALVFHEQLRGKKTAKDLLEAVRALAEASLVNLAVRAHRAFTNTKYLDGDSFEKFVSDMERYRRQLKGDSEVKDSEMIVQMMSNLPASWDTFLQGLRSRTDVMSNYTKFKAEIHAEHQWRGDNNNEKKPTGSRGVAMQAKQSTPKFKGKCNNCGKSGHKKSDCWGKGSDKEGQGPKQKDKKNNEKKANQVNQSRNYVLTAAKIKSAEGDWILDSGASNHMTGDKHIIKGLTHKDDLGKVTVASGDQFEITGTGSVELKGEEGIVTITGVLYVPDLSVNLLSISALSTKGAIVNFDEKGASVSINEEVILRATDIREGLYTLKNNNAGLTTTATTNREITMKEAHRFMGHLNAGDYNEDLQKWVEDQLATKYEVKFMGEIHTLLGSVINVKDSCASFQQSSYLESIGQQYGLENTKHRTPIEAGIKLPEEAAGRSWNSTGACWVQSSLKRLVGYLVNMRGLELRYTAGKANLIEAWVDASHLSEGAYGVSGHAVFVGGNLVSWRSRKQRTVALSSMEAEVNALVDVVKEVMWLKELLTDLGVSGIKTVVYEDNQAAIASSKHAIVNDRTRHILGKTTFMRETIKEHNIELVFIPTKDQKADGLTEAKGPSEFERFRAGMGLETSVAGKGEC
ncbi:hypothetical protein CcCBS67573_g05520 [Chytriomyces confervae]|uniref:CCHC-type domain-containing protein n=1 Tax=Chytriomyces confervae TaxID=246404 RepID=A0A507FCB3_9FUNG|nr:hypothetical protein CcCBS67573_g05520 [Chytriomyces confervae]